MVEYVHPVIVGKRALPAFALAGPDQPAQLELLAAPEDIALGLASSTTPPRSPTRWRWHAEWAC